MSSMAVALGHRLRGTTTEMSPKEPSICKSSKKHDVRNDCKQDD